MELYGQFIITCCLLNLMALIAGQQGVPPGVPPQHYQQHQQQMPQMQQHQMHVQQQMPVHQVRMHQDVPMQQVPQQQMHMQQQVPQQQMHMQQQQVPQQHGGHPHAHGQPQVLNVANIAQEKQHIAEHLSVPIDTNKMSEQELQFHYFKMHDSDNNNKLDGCELIKSLIHWHEQGHGEPGKPQVQEKLFRDEELVSLIDPILGMDDTNNDGYIDYPEFVRAQQKNAVGHPPPQQRK